MGGVMSIDALQLMPHREAALAEVFRILKPGGRFAFMTWLSRQADKLLATGHLRRVPSMDDVAALKEAVAAVYATYLARVCRMRK
jgi:ubiquinone/menaquinone biosynthesis C-methylase UbiE